MIFTEFRFLFFFALVFVVRWMLRGLTGQKLWLLLCSWVFYAAWDWRFLSLIWISTAVDYLVGLRLGAEVNPMVRKRWITVSVVTNLGILGVFKYFNFFAGSLTSLLSYLGLALSYNVIAIVLPVGISFYTFHRIALMVHRLWEPVGTKLPNVLGRGFGLILTFWWVNLAWIFFRAPDLGQAMSISRSFVLFADSGPRSLGPGLLWLLAALAALHLAGYFSQQSQWWRDLPGWVFSAGVGALVALALALIHPSAQPFIYFQF